MAEKPINPTNWIHFRCQIQGQVVWEGKKTVDIELDPTITLRTALSTLDPWRIRGEVITVPKASFITVEEALDA